MSNTVSSSREGRHGFAVLVGCVLAASVLAGCTDAPDSVDAAETRDAAMAALEVLRSQAHRSDCSGGSLVEYDLWVEQIHQWEPYEGNTVTGFAFGASPDGPFGVPGPTLRATQCDTLRVRLHVLEGQFSHTIHWHGISLPWGMDGVAYVTQDVGSGIFTYEFDATESGTYWYHCHVEAPVHIDIGMYGALIIDPQEPTADLPYDHEAIIMLGAHDPAWTTAFEVLEQSPTANDGDAARNPFDTADDAERAARSGADLGGLITGDTMGHYGTSVGPRPYYNEPSLRYRPQYSVFMMNGKSYPDTEPVMTESGDTVRIRLISASALVHSIHLHGHHFLVTHKDGYPLLAPYYADTLLIGSGERYDLYIKSDNPGIWDFHDHGGGWGYGGHASNDYAFPGGMNTMFVYEDFEYAQLPGFEPGTAKSGDYAVFSEDYKGAARPLDRWD